MVSKLLPVGLMVCGIGFSLQTANAQQSDAWNGGCQSAAPSGPEPAEWHGPQSYQPGPEQDGMAPTPAPSQAPVPAPDPQTPGRGPMTPQQQPGQQQSGQRVMNDQQAPAAQGQTAQGQTAQGHTAQGQTAQGQTAQSNDQTYQSFSAEPGAARTNAPNTNSSYPMDGGYNGCGNWN